MLTALRSDLIKIILIFRIPGTKSARFSMFSQNRNYSGESNESFISFESMAEPVARNNLIQLIERLFEMSRFRLVLAIWTSVSVAILVFVANRSFKPELVAPAALISNLDVIRLTADDSLRLRMQWPLAVRDLEEVEGLFRALDARHTFHPISLKISSQKPLEFKIEPDSISLGIAYALAPGQLAHAILQNWFIQTKPVQNYSDRLQQILYADVFWAAAHGSFDLGLPDGTNSLSLSALEIRKASLQEILFHAGSSLEVFTSDWAPQEMRIANLAQAISTRKRSINPLSLRKFLLLQILKSEALLSIDGRINFLEKVLLKTSYSSFSQQVDLTNLTAFINQTFTDFGIQTKLEKRAFSVDALFDSNEALKTALPFSISYLLKNSDGLTLFPGNIIVTTSEMKDLSIRTLIFAAKKIADIRKFESTLFTAKKILAIENPRAELINYDALKDADFDRFAKRNKKIRFAVFDQESLNFAARKNLVAPLSKLLESSDSHSQNLAAASKTLGMTSPHWDAVTQTYRASGTIEALQIWRPMIDPSIQ